MLKAFAISILVLMALAVSATMAAGTWVLAAGVGTVQVRTAGPEGVNLYLPVPIGLVDLGLTVASICVPRHELAEIREEIRSEAGDWQPFMERLTRELTGGPDGVLVQVRTEEERVSIVKKRGRLNVDVDAPDATVRVSIPARSLSRIARRLDGFLEPETL